MHRVARLASRAGCAAACAAGGAAHSDADEISSMLKVSITKIEHLSALGFESRKVCNKTSFGYAKFISDKDCVLGDVVVKDNDQGRNCADPVQLQGFMRAGPREILHFDPSETRVAIVTCGGLCPGLNSVVSNLVHILKGHYGVGKIFGVRGGYRGFTQVGWDPPIELTVQSVDSIHHDGGTILGTSRGGFDADKIVEWLKAKRINQLYVIGGDGTLRGAFKLVEACQAKGLNIAIAGVPKTIDNDIGIIDRSFGFMTAVSEATRAIAAARTEAECNMPNGIGIVKLMGRSAGFLAAYATLASQDVDLCLVPEVDIVLEGPGGVLPHLERVLGAKGHAVVVVAEGAGEELLGTQRPASEKTDAGGNRELPQIGPWISERIKDHFKAQGKEATVKYIDPSYMVRSVAADASDSYLCMLLAHAAAHGAMAGYTGFTVGLVNNRTVMIPIPELCSKSPRSLNVTGRTWERVNSVTGQPHTAVHTSD
ncbi:phosphofructokinase domain-containing protein [Pelagophyceae sp. CCMP2097]|nr:phosphofructokinase domain-containing protein [Pelagophyceae sp. CCMP2097]